MIRATHILCFVLLIQLSYCLPASLGGTANDPVQKFTQQVFCALLEMLKIPDFTNQCGGLLGPNGILGGSNPLGNLFGGSNNPLAGALGDGNSNPINIFGGNILGNGPIIPTTTQGSIAQIGSGLQSIVDGINPMAG